MYSKKHTNAKFCCQLLLWRLSACKNVAFYFVNSVSYAIFVLNIQLIRIVAVYMRQRHFDTVLNLIFEHYE